MANKIDRAISESLAQHVYGKSASPDAPENQNDEWRAGFDVGTRYAMDEWDEQFHPVTNEYLKRTRGFGGELHGEMLEAFGTWKRGLWAGVFTALQNKVSAVKQAEDSGPDNSEERPLIS